MALHHVLVSQDWSQGEVAYGKFGFALVALGCGEAEGKVRSASSTVITMVVGMVLRPCLAQLFQLGDFPSVLAGERHTLRLI